MDAQAAQWFEQARTGDAAALEHLLQRYLPQLHAFVHVRLGALRGRESSMDVVQSVCRELLGARSTFEFRGEDRFRAWLFTAALNKLNDKRSFHGQQRRDLRRDDPRTDPVLLAANLLTPSVDAIGHETAVALQDALAALSEEHREVITMARIVDLPHRVIAEVLGRSEAAVRQLLVRALLRLSAELRQRGIRLDG
ncbi:MAG: sigma-70 family RNA polymerase sigma factor [Planctomycetes bacterium]|nr:sigma-70 family RNA polymerase sigma factor [Planctomycetota bacterium]